MSDEFEVMRVPPPERLYVDALGYVWQDGALPGHLSMARTTDRNVASPGLIEYRPVVVTEEKARRVVNADVVLAALRTIGVGLAAARGAHERAVAVSNARARLARLVDQIEGQARLASPVTRETVTEAKAAAWDEAIAALFAWWQTPEDERGVIVNPYGTHPADRLLEDIEKGDDRD